MRTCRKGFTIVEMLMVIGILAVLLGLVTVAASAAIRRGRARRADAMMQTLQNGISTYYARKDKWPGKLEAWARDGISGKDNDHVATLDDGDYDNVMTELLEAQKQGSAMMDFGGMLAGPKSAANGKQNGIDYKTWAQKVKSGDTKRMPAGMTASRSSITFGYSGTENGRFYRFKITYNADTDHVTVSK